MTHGILDPAPGPAPRARAPRGVEDLERELKFVLPAGRAQAAAGFLATICVPDTEYPRALVWTVYYDTPDGRSLGEKLDSDYLKMKLRVRWYGDEADRPSGPVFIEAKYRIGSRREKVRVKLDIDAREAAGLALESPRFAAFPRALAPAGVPAGPEWRPVVRLRYRRIRFIERLTGARVSLDRDITAEAVNSRQLTSLNLGPLPVAVLEVKGREDTLPRPLTPLLHLGARQGSLSKYAAVYDHVRRMS